MVILGIVLLMLLATVWQVAKFANRHGLNVPAPSLGCHGVRVSPGNLPVEFEAWHSQAPAARISPGMERVRPNSTRIRLLYTHRPPWRAWYRLVVDRCRPRGVMSIVSTDGGPQCRWCYWNMEELMRGNGTASR